MRSDLHVGQWQRTFVMLCVGLCCPCAAKGSNDPGKILNPQYAAWEHFPIGSSATAQMDLATPKGPAHMEVTTALRAVSDSGVTVSITAIQTIGGQKYALPERLLKYEHRMPSSNLKNLDDVDVEVQDMRYRCQAYEVASGQVGGDDRAGGKSKIYLNSSVPGGAVKVEIASVSGTPVVATLVRFTTSPGGNGERPESVPTSQPVERHWQTSFGRFSFEAPKGWTVISAERPKTKAFLVSDASIASPPGMIVVDVGRPVLPTAEELAKQMAGNDGRISPVPVTVDGTKGLRVDRPAVDASRPAHVVIVYRGEIVYLIMAARAHDADVSKPFEQILTTWRWIDEPGARHP